MSIATELTKLSNTKLDIKHAIQDKGVIVRDEDTFDTYADKIENIAGYGENIDISKTDYSIGNGGYPTVVEEGRLFHPIYYANTNVVIRPMDSSGNWLDVDWTKDFEIFITFQVTSLSSQLSLFTNGILNTSYEYSPTIFLSNNNLRVLLCGGGSSWDLTYDTNFTPVIDTWYALSMKYTALTNIMTVNISTDFENWTNLMTQVLTFTIQHDAASLIFGGRGYEPQNWNPGNLIIDTFNTYIKNNTGEIIWGTFTGRLEGDDFPIGCAEEYEIYDYIESDGTGYIETNYHPVTGDVISARYTPTISTMQYGWIYFAGEGDAYIGITYNPNGIAYWYNGTSGASYYKSEQFYTDRIYNYDISISPSQNSTFKICYGSAYFKIYQVKINNDYLLPCKRKSDGIFGLYNVNQNKFLIDSNNGASFTGGNYMYTLAGKIITVNSGTSVETIYFGKESQWLGDSYSTPIEFDIKTIGDRFSEYLSTTDYKTFTALKDFDAIITVGAMEDLTHTGVNPPSCSFFVNECTSRHKSGTDRDTGFMGVTAANGQPGTTAFTHFPFSFKAGDTMYWGSINTYGWVVRLGQIDVVEGIDISGYVQPSF